MNRANRAVGHEINNYRSNSLIASSGQLQRARR